MLIDVLEILKCASSWYKKGLLHSFLPNNLLFSFFFRKSCCFGDNVEKYRRAGQSRDNTAHAYCTLDI
jgi:hypothetical protein